MEANLPVSVLFRDFENVYQPCCPASVRQAKVSDENRSAAHITSYFVGRVADWPTACCKYVEMTNAL